MIQQMQQEGALKRAMDLARSIFPENISESREILRDIRESIYVDLSFVAFRDPSSRGDVLQINRVRKASLATGLYRLSNCVWYDLEDHDLAYDLHEMSKKETAIDIHPAATIAVPFSIDHGVNTVIGETTAIGARCVILNAVTLGAREIQDIRGKRHPTIGDNVTICGHVGVYGNITIGNNCTLCPGVHVTHSVPDNSQVKLVSQNQILRTLGVTPNSSPTILTVVPEMQPITSTPHCVTVLGTNFCDTPSVSLVNAKGQSIEATRVVRNSGSMLVCDFELEPHHCGIWGVRTENQDGQACTLTECYHTIAVSD